MNTTPTHGSIPPSALPAMNRPSDDEMYAALVAQDASYEGVFIVCVRTTGIFCRPTCPARKPLRANVEFCPGVGDALASGYRPCKRCRPLSPAGSPPPWLAPLLDDIEADPTRRWRDADLRARSLDPSRVRRWFKTHHGITFHAYQRARRLGRALGQIRLGDGLSGAAYDHGWESESAFREAFGKLFGATPGRSREAELMLVTRLLTPLGPMLAGATDRGVCLLEFADRRMLETQIKRVRSRLSCTAAPGEHEHVRALDIQLREYFGGTRRTFTVPLLSAGTAFQREVWTRLAAVPFGATSTYARLAAEIGRPRAMRAVGRANGDNPLAIVVPCHRIVRSDGALCGYGGGLWRKRWLLDHETRAA